MHLRNSWVLVLGMVAWAAAGEDPSLPPYKWPNYPRYSLRTEHQPIKGWKIETLYRGEGEVFLRESGRERKANKVKSKDNPTLKGPDEHLYLLHFDYEDYRRLGGVPIGELEIDPKRPVFLGWDFNDFSTRFRRWTGERGFSRKYVIPAEFSGENAVPLDVPQFQVDRKSKDADWQRFLLPVVTAEGGGDYLIINGFDKAGMTVGFIQMAAHTPNDMIPLMRHLIECQNLKNDSYADPGRWFPELGITVDGKLGYRTANGVVSLEECTKHRNSNEGFRRSPSWAYFREDFVRFCNPSVKEINRGGTSLRGAVADVVAFPQDAGCAIGPVAGQRGSHPAETGKRSSARFRGRRCHCRGRSPLGTMGANTANALPAC